MGCPVLIKRAYGICAIGSLCLALRLNAQTQVAANTVSEVSIPVLVELGSGEAAFGLSPTNFSLTDDGVEQRFQLNRDADTKPVALLLVVQTGHDATKALREIAGLSDSLDSFLSKPEDQVAVLTFDSSPHLIQGFTSDSAVVANTLSSISKGNASAALFDAMNLAIGYFRRAPADDEKVIFLISGEHDHGSIGYDMNAEIRAAASSDISIYSFSFRPGVVKLFGRLRAFNPLDIATSAMMKKNAGAALAELTGGEFFRFNSEAELENCINRVANHLRNRYTLTFKPSSRQPGFHAVQVAVHAPGANVASAREGYWISQAATPRIGGN
jgi:VWFA-related protein